MTSTPTPPVAEITVEQVDKWIKARVDNIFEDCGTLETTKNASVHFMKMVIAELLMDRHNMVEYYRNQLIEANK